MKQAHFSRFLKIKQLIVLSTLSLSALVFLAGLAPAGAVVSAATAPAPVATLKPLPLRELMTAQNQKYLYTSSWSEASGAVASYGMKMTSSRPLGYILTGSDGAYTTPLYRLQQTSTGNWIVSSSPSEEAALVKSGFQLQGSIGNIYTQPVNGAQLVNRYTNGKGWRLAYNSQDSSMKAAGYTSDGPIGYLLPQYNQIGAYYFGAYDKDTSAGILQASQNVYGRSDPWAGIRDFHGDPNSPWGNIPQNTQGWTGDYSYLKPAQGYYDDSNPATLATQIYQATQAGLSYFAFYAYWNDQTATMQYNDAINAFLAAPNSQNMQFMVTPCLTYDNNFQHLSVPASQYTAAANAFAGLTAKPNYLRTQDGRPMIFMCDSRGIGDGSVSAVNTFTADLRQAVKQQTGQNPYILQHSELGLNTVKQYDADAYSCLNMGAFVQAGSYANYVSQMGSYFSPFDTSGRPMIRCAMSGFNEAPRTNLVLLKNQIQYFKDDTKSQFPAAMQATYQNMQSQPASPVDNYMTIYAWNEWAEGGIIEPNVRDGNYYLNAITKTFGLRPLQSPVPSGSVTGGPSITPVSSSPVPPTSGTK
jgi:hypothetical protein